MPGVGTRIKKARSAIGMTQALLAKIVGVSQQAVVELESGRAKGTKHCVRFARALGQDPLWIETGEGRIRESGAARRHARGEADANLPELADYERVPIFDIRMPGVRGALSDTKRAAGFSLFSTKWLRALTPAPLSKLAVILMAGDSMEPTLHNGDHALVDTVQSDLRREGIYLLDMDGTMMVRRVSMHPGDKRLTIASDNPRYRAYDDLDPNALAAMGRVVWLGRTLG